MAVDARRVYGMIAAAAVALTLAVVVASACLRHSQSPRSCEPWPACAARADVDSTAEAGTFVRVARIVHRLSATAVVAAILALMLVAWTQRPVWLREALVATAALVVAGALAVLGAATGGSQSPPVVLGNLLGGYVLLALAATAWGYASNSADAGRDTRIGARVAVGAVLVAAALGVSRIGIPSQLPHWLTAVIVLLLVAWLALRLRGTRPRVAATLSLALAIVVAFGIAALVMRPSLALAVPHNTAAAVALVALAIAGAKPG